MAEKYTLPHIDWDETFEKLRELADKADSLASDMMETDEYGNKMNPMHDNVYMVAKELLTMMSRAAEMGNEIAVELERQNKRHGRKLESRELARAGLSEKALWIYDNSDYAVTDNGDGTYAVWLYDSPVWDSVTAKELKEAWEEDAEADEAWHEHEFMMCYCGIA